MKEIESLSKDVKSLIDSVRERDEKLSDSEKKYDGQLKELEEKLTKVGEDLSNAYIKLEEEKKEREALEKLYNQQKSGLAKNQENNEYKKAFNSYLRKGIEPSDELMLKGVEEACEENLKSLEDVEHKRLVDLIKNECGQNNGYLLPSEQKTLRTNVNPDGGYWVLPQRSNAPVTREFETSPMRTVSEVVSISTNEYEVVLDDDEAASGGWVGEEESRPSTGTPKIGLLTFPVHEQAANPRVTQKMLDDAGFNVENWLSNKVNDILSRHENTAFVSGDGSKKPKGFLSYAAWAAAGTYERTKLEYVNSGSAGNFKADTIIDVQNSLKSGYQGNAIWGIKRDSWRYIAKLKDGVGRYLLDMDAFKNGFMMMLLGKPVVFMNDMESVATDAKALVYGDFRKGYVVVDRFGTRVLRDPFTSKPFIQFYTTKRVGGGVKDFEALKIYKLSA